MRVQYAFVLAILASTAQAQTVNTVQNGAWSAPATWSCNCVPVSTASLVVMHSVELLGDLTITNPQVQVTSTGEITTSFPVTLTLNGVFIMEGHVFISGWVYNYSLLDVTGLFEVAGDFISDGQVQMDGGTLIVEGGLTNYSSITGDGSICVVDSTVNHGSITGPLDFCDQSPTVGTPPFLDVNTGTVGSAVTFCTNSSCITGIADHAVQVIALAPNPASDRMTIFGTVAGDAITVVDASGRQGLRMKATADRTELDLAAMANGAYRVIVRSRAAVRALPLIIAR